LLRDPEELAHANRQDEEEEIRSDRKEARRVFRIQNKMIAEASKMLRTFFVGLLLVPLAFAQAGAVEKHKLALQISDNDATKMNAVLNVAANVSNYYSDKGEEIDIQIVAFNAGLHMLRDDTSPVKTR